MMLTNMIRNRMDIRNTTVLNLESQYRFIKNMATRAALRMAMAMATTTLNGSGILIHVTATVRKVRTSSVPATLIRVAKVDM